MLRSAVGEKSRTAAKMQPKGREKYELNILPRDVIIKCKVSSKSEVQSMGFFKYNGPFANFMGKLADVVILGLLTVICSLPIFTIGAAFSSLYYVTLKMARKEEYKVFRSYFKAFKDNFVKGTLLWLFMALVGFVLYLDFILLYQREIPGEYFVWIMMFIVAVVLVMIGSYILPLQAQFENPVSKTIKNAFIVSIMNTPRSLLIVLVGAVPLVLLFFNPNSLYILGIFCIAGIPYLKSEIFIKVFDKYMPKEEEPEVEDFESDYAFGEAPTFPLSVALGEDLLAPEEEDEEPATSADAYEKDDEPVEPVEPADGAAAPEE